MNFQRLRLSRRLIPSGFVFIWADRENIPSIIDIFENKGFFYVENLVWVQSHDEDALQLKEVRIPGTVDGRKKFRCFAAAREHFWSYVEVGESLMGILFLLLWICAISATQMWLFVPTAFVSVSIGGYWEVESIMERSIYVTMETLVPRALDGGLDNSNFYLQIFGDSKFSRRVRTVGRSDL